LTPSDEAGGAGDASRPPLAPADLLLLGQRLTGAPQEWLRACAAARVLGRDAVSALMRPGSPRYVALSESRRYRSAHADPRRLVDPLADERAADSDDLAAAFAVASVALGLCAGGEREDVNSDIGASGVAASVSASAAAGSAAATAAATAAAAAAAAAAA
jgi:hypothetical protein